MVIKENDMSELIFVDNKGNQSRVNVPDFCKIELSIQDGKVVHSRVNKELNFIVAKTLKNVAKTT